LHRLALLLCRTIIFSYYSLGIFFRSGLSFIILVKLQSYSLTLFKYADINIALICRNAPLNILSLPSNSLEEVNRCTLFFCIISNKFIIKVVSIIVVLPRPI
jgi:hypothetical protein